MMWCRVGVQGEMWSEARGGCRAAQSRVKSGVPGGMWSEVQGEMQGEARSRRRSVRRCGAGREEMGRGKNGVRNHFGRHFTNIVYIIKKMF